IWASTAARTSAERAGRSPMRASSSSIRAPAVRSAKGGFLGRASVSASVIAEFLQLVERLDRLAGGHLVGPDGVERFVNGVRALRRRSGPVGEQRQIV